MKPSSLHRDQLVVVDGIRDQPMGYVEIVGVDLLEVVPCRRGGRDPIEEQWQATAGLRIVATFFSAINGCTSRNDCANAVRSKSMVSRVGVEYG